MRIESSTLQLESSAARFESLTRTRRTGPNPSPQEGASPSRDLIELSREAIAAFQREVTSQASARSDTPTVDSDANPMFSLFKSLIERLIGHEIKTFSASDLPPPRDVPALQAPPSTARGFEAYRRYEEYERVDFSAAGVVKTADGQEVRFALEVTMERHYVEESWIRVGAPPARKDPLVLNFGGTAAELTNQTFAFDLNGDGVSNERLPGFGAGMAWLVFDRNGDGKVDSGNELFGPQTDDGFAELAQLDADGNGWIDEADPLFSKLGVWRPDANGGAIQSLLAANVGALNLAHVITPITLGSGRDGHGALRDSGVFLKQDGGAGLLQEIDLNI